MQNLKLIWQALRRRLVIRDEGTTRVIAIAWPVLIELLLSSLFSMVDMMMLGNVAGRELANQSVAAVGIVNQALFVGLALVQSLNVGGTAIVARYLGSGQKNRIEQTLKHVILLNFIGLTIPFFLFCQFYAPNIMAFIGADADVVAVGTPYFRIIITGFLFSSINSSFIAVLRGVGETKSPMRVNLIANSANVVGNAVLIFGLLGFPALGIVGAGISTALSNVLAFFLMLRLVTGGDSIIHLSLRNKFRFSRDILANLVKIGVPASGEQMVMRVGMMTFTKVVANLGTTVFAAHQIAMSIMSLSFNPGMAFGIASSSLVGYSLGQKSLEQAKNYTKRARRLGTIFSSTMAVFIFILAPQLAGLYNKDPLVVENAVRALRIIAVIQPFQASQLTLSGALRGAGDTIWTLVSTTSGILILRSSLSLLFVNYFQLGISGAWLAVLFDQLLRWLIIYFRFKTDRWQHIKIR
jgi:putative MATE family efflux protein